MYIPCRRMDFAVHCLQEGSGLAKDLATGRKPVDNRTFIKVFNIFNKIVKD